jgi:hypothetical protein
MDVFKLAFETVIIGLFALPWLWVMIDLVNPDLFNYSAMSRLAAIIPDNLRPTIVGLALFSVTYLLGSILTPVASEFLNDRDMLGSVLPTEEKIEAATYRRLGAPSIPGLVVPKVELVKFPVEERMFRRAVHHEFWHEESTLLLRGSDACRRLNRLHEQMTVLQGATFSAFALMVLCGFAWCGRCRKSPKETGDWLSAWPRVRRWFAFALSTGLIVVSANELVKDLDKPELGDMPIAELVLLLLGSFGLYVAIRGTQSKQNFHGLGFVLAFCLTLLCYSGFGCSERSYDEAIFNTYQALSPGNTASSSKAAGEFALATTSGE